MHHSIIWFQPNIFLVKDLKDKLSALHKQLKGWSKGEEHVEQTMSSIMPMLSRDSAKTVMCVATSRPQTAETTETEADLCQAQSDFQEAMVVVDEEAAPMAVAGAQNAASDAATSLGTTNRIVNK
jgi:hypothetical protein